jgi:glycosyltransferase involved in cell wall biosynthesis
LSTAVSILIRTDGDEEPLRNCLLSLARFAPAECFIYVLDDRTADDGIGETCEQLKSSLPGLVYIRGEIKRGFLDEHICETERDVLLLGANTEVTAGFLDELKAVLYLHERHGAVSPRSNNAALFSVPFTEAGFDAGASYAAWQQIKYLLPRYQMMPAAAGFCVLIKAKIFQRFHFLDDDENDFIRRINRYGYSAIAANWAYVFHKPLLLESGETKLEEARRERLQLRYPEYERELTDYQQLHRNPLERFASLYTPHRPRILYDLFHLTPAHSGTSDFGLNLLRELSRIAEDEFELVVGMNPSARLFANELTGYRFYEDREEDHAPFDLVFKPCQITSWTELRQMNQRGARISYTLLDIIGIRCEYLNSPRRQILLQRASTLVDCVFAISEFSRSDFVAYYQMDIPMRVIHLGTNSGMTEGEFRTGEYILLVGNDFVHKGVQDAVRHLSRSTLPLVVLGGKEESTAANIRWLSSGNLSRQHMRELFVNARVLVYPSYYEGFGLPVVDALALGKPVVVLESETNRELAAAHPQAGLHPIQSMDDLYGVVTKLFEMEPVQIARRPGEKPRRWNDVAADYLQAFREILRRDIDVAKMRARWEILRTLDSAD